MGRQVLPLTTQLVTKQLLALKGGQGFTNLLPDPSFRFLVSRRVLRMVVQLGRFAPNVVLWYYQTLVRFVEVATGKRGYFKFNPFIENSLGLRELALCTL